MNIENNKPYSTLSAEDFEKALSELMLVPPQRNMTFSTGFLGMEMFDNAVEDTVIREPLRNQAKEMLDGGLLNEQKYDNLITMINSPDKENLVLAREVMTVMKKN